MKKIKDFLIILIFLSIAAAFIIYTFPKPIELKGSGAIFSGNNEGEIVEANISGEISKKPFKKSIFKGNIKIGEETYKNIIYYFNKNSNDTIIYAPSGDKYTKLGRAYNKNNLDYFAIDFDIKEDLFVFPVKNIEEGRELYKELKK